MTIEKTQQQKESDKLLKTVLDLRFFNPWKHFVKYADERALFNDANVELYVTSTCNQKCEYCYLQKHEKLYPKDINDPKTILRNLEIFLKYLLINDYNCNRLDIFSGEIWHTQYGWDILEKIYEYVEKGLKIQDVMMTSNCSFIENEIAFQKMQQFVNRFKAIGVPLIISISVDGKIIDDMERPRNDKDKSYSDDFYEKLGAFSVVNNFWFHPMVAPNSVKYWKENYLWWEKYLKYYGFTTEAIMTLEVRNAGWTDEQIQDYCDFLRFLMDKYMKEEFHNDPEHFARSIAAVRMHENDVHLNGYIPWALAPVDSFIGCTIPNHLTIRLGDLAICPCHRTSYEEYLYGKFDVEDGKITGITAINPDMAIKILMNNVLTSNPLCDQCVISPFCMRGCLGSQYETEKDPFFPIENICKFFKAKYGCIFDYYREHGIIDCLKRLSLEEPGSDRIIQILQVNDMLEAEKNGMGKI